MLRYSIGSASTGLFMANLLDKNLHLRILVIDSDLSGASRLSRAFSELQGADENLVVTSVGTIKDGYEVLSTFRPNVLFIDLVSTKVRDSVTYVQHLRQSHPTIVVVLYCNTGDIQANESTLYSGWGERLRHYFLLPKETTDESFVDQLLFNLNRVQLDLYAYGAQESLLRAEQANNFPAYSEVQLSKIRKQIHSLSRDLENYLSHGQVQSSKRAFVIGAISEDLRDVYELGIREPLTQFDLEAYRVDEHYRDGLIIDRIYNEIDTSIVIVAELTHPRPNCYYELGYADGLGKPVVRVARKGTELPFDVNQHPFLFYTDVTDLREKLGKALRDINIKSGGE